MKIGCLVVAALIALPLGAQEQKPAPKKKAARPPPAAHRQASKEEIRRFNDLEKRQRKEAK